MLSSIAAADSTTPLGWAQPNAWPAVLVAVVAILVAHRLRSRGIRRDRQWLGPRHAALSDRSLRRTRLRAFSSSIGTLALTIALLQPTAGRGAAADVRRPVDLVVGLDISRSMLARDIAPTRLAAAHRAIRELARLMAGDALSLVAFAGTTRTLVPLTRDSLALGELVELAEPSAITTGGTDLGAVLQAGLKILRRAKARRRASASPRPQAILLVTDGEDLADRGVAAARECAAAGVRVYCLGIGSELGSKIALPSAAHPTTDATTPFLVDRSGREVVSAVDRPGLDRIAAAGSGRSVYASGRGTAEGPVVAIRQLFANQLEPLGRSGAQSADDGSAATPRFQLPLLVAGVGWLLAIGWGARRPRRAARVDREVEIAT